MDENIDIRETWNKGRLCFTWQILCSIRSIPTIKLVHLQHEFNQFGNTLTIPAIPLLLWIIRFILRKKVIITYHEVMGQQMLTPELIKRFCLPVPSRPAQLLFRIYYRITSFASNTILVQHQHLEARLRTEMGVSGNIRILPIGTEVDAQLAQPEPSRNRYGYRAMDRVLLFFGTIDWRKGMDILIEAFESLPGDSYQLLIGGGQPVRIRHLPEYMKWYRDLEKKISRNPRIKQVGFVSDQDIPALFAASDLVVLPYVVPQMVSAVLNHAASFERPFIGSDAFEGHADSIALFKATAPDLAAKIEWAFEHQDELLEYARKYKQDMSWTNSAALLSGYYADTIAAKSEF